MANLGGRIGKSRFFDGKRDAGSTVEIFPSCRLRGRRRLVRFPRQPTDISQQIPQDQQAYNDNNYGSRLDTIQKAKQESQDCPRGAGVE
jgi:hypothetical protein